MGDMADSGKVEIISFSSVAFLPDDADAEQIWYMKEIQARQLVDGMLQRGYIRFDVSKNYGLERKEVRATCGVVASSDSVGEISARRAEERKAAVMEFAGRLSILIGLYGNTNISPGTHVPKAELYRMILDSMDGDDD